MENLLRFGSTTGFQLNTQLWLKSLMLESVGEVTADSLINAETRSWDTNTVDGIFTPTGGFGNQKAIWNQRTRLFGQCRRMGSTHASQDTNFWRRNQSWIDKSLTKTMTRTCGKEFGLCRLQISSEILLGRLVETLYHQRKIWFDVPSSETPHETGVPWLRKILCTLYELAPNWMLSGLILSYGILGAKLSSKI